MNTNERNTDAMGHAVHNGSQVNPEGFKPQQSAGVEIPMSDTSADLHDVWLFFGMAQHGVQAIWDLCRSVNPDHQYYRQKLAEAAEIARAMRHRTNGRTA